MKGYAMRIELDVLSGLRALRGFSLRALGVLCGSICENSRPLADDKHRTTTLWCLIAAISFLYAQPQKSSL